MKIKTRLPKFYLALGIVGSQMLMMCLLPAHAASYDIPGYHIQLLPPPPGATEGTQAFSLNNKGIVVGNSDSGSWQYDTKTGAYSPVDDFQAVAISNNGVMAGRSLANNCAIRDQNGNVTEFSTPTLDALNLPCNLGARAISENGVATGFQILPDGTWFGFAYDSKTGTTEEFLANPVRTIAQGITNSGTIVGTSIADDGARAAFVRDSDETVRTFRASNPDAIPVLTNARGISENGKVISGFYVSVNFELVAFIVDSSTLSDGAGQTDVDVTPLDIRPCNPDSSPPPGYITLTDALAFQVRDDGVIVGNCQDVYWDPVNDPGFWNLIFDFGYTFIATPQ